LKDFAIRLSAACLLTALAFTGASAQTQKGVPPALAGTITARPSGQLAFLREGDVWIMNVDGTGQQRVAQIKNADGRLSWSPDGKQIAYTRSGKFEFSEPDNSGGRKKLYDVFICYLDSAKAGNTMWYRRITMQLGGRDPEWSADGSTIIFTNDVNASQVNAYGPNYQICTVDPDGGHLQMLRKDWQSMKEFLINPTMNAAGDLAFEVMMSTPNPTNPEATSFRRQGIAVLSRTGYMTSLDSIKTAVRKMNNCLSPAWSPDGQWLAYVKNDVSKSAVYIAKKDLSQSYLLFEPPAGATVCTVAPSFSPDSKWLTFSTDDGSIYICQITGNGLRRLTGPGADLYPAWSKAPVAPTSSPRPTGKK
jgi:Tol biopolymer transport system component